MFTLGFLKKTLFWLLVLLAVFCLLLVAQIKTATWLFDSKIGSTLAKIENRVPGLQLEYTPGNDSFTERKGRLFYRLPLKPGNTLGEDFISGAIDLRLLFGPLRLSGAVQSVAGAGNLEAILAKYHVDPVSFTGVFNATAVSPKLEGSLKTDSFLIPTSTGICKLGQNSLSFHATSTEDVDVSFRSAGAVCEGAMRYNDKPNYRLDLTGLDVRFLPRIINKKPHFESLVVNLQQLEFKFSTLYAIGFDPDDNVRDPSIQDAISFNNISTMITLTQPDSEGMTRLSFENSGNYGFAFPYIRYNVVQPYYQLDNFKIDADIERISIPNLLSAAQNIVKSADSEFDTKKVVHEILRGFTDLITLTVNNFGYSHKGESFNISGKTLLSFDEHGAKPKISRFDSEYKIRADRNLVLEVAGEDYSRLIHDGVAAGQITDDGVQYTTEVKLQGKSVTMNGIPLTDLKTQDDLLYEEEQRALKEQQAQEQADKAALEAEIEAAKRAQENLPSLVEGNLNSASDMPAEAE